MELKEVGTRNVYSLVWVPRRRTDQEGDLELEDERIEGENTIGTEIRKWKYTLKHVCSKSLSLWGKTTTATPQAVF